MCIRDSTTEGVASGTGKVCRGDLHAVCFLGIIEQAVHLGCGDLCLDVYKRQVVYRLDRISRNISDFSSLIEELGRLGIDFVSIRESCDTASPMGRAMRWV